MKAGCRIVLLLLVCLFPAGCRHNSNQELLENELRARDFQYRDLLDEMKKSEFHKDALAREIEALRAGSQVTPELAAQTFGVRRITLGRGTSAIDVDHLPGDDALQVVIEPRDADDHIIKAPGNVLVTALEINSQGGKSPLSTWEIAPEQLRRDWKQSLFSNGYVLTLPWRSWPQSENLRVVVKLILADGRAFEADRDIRVRLPVGVKPKADAPPPSEPLPFPRESQSRSDRTPIQQTGWQPAPLTNVVNLGRPEPLDPRPPVHLLGLRYR